MSHPTMTIEELLLSLLERARNGELSSIAVAVTNPDLCTASAWAFESATLAELLGSVDVLHHRLLHEAQDAQS